MPQPTTTGGGLMGYPTTVDTGGVVPQALLADFSDPSVGAAGTLTAGIAYLSPVSLLVPMTITQMRCTFSGTPTGNCDMGIYDATDTNGAPGSLLGHTGAIAAVTGVFTQNLTANLAIAPGAYWLAWVDTVADTVWRTTGPGQTNNAIYKRSNSSTLTVLPASFAAATSDTGNRPVIVALRSGGYS